MVEPLANYPNMEKVLRESAADCGFESIIPRMGIEVLRDYALGRGDRTEIEIKMWEFLLARNDGEWVVLPVERGRFEQEVGMDAPKNTLLQLRIVRLVLDGSAEKLDRFFDTPMSVLN